MIQSSAVTPAGPRPPVRTTRLPSSSSLPSLDVAPLHDVLVVQRQHVPLVLVREDRGVRARAAPGAPRRSATRIRTREPGTNCASGFGTTPRTWIVPVCGSTWLLAKSSTPACGKAVVGLQAEGEGELRLADRRRPGRAGFAADCGVALERTLVDVEVDVDRVDRDDRRQHRVAPAGVDEVAGGQHRPADAPGDRRGDLRVLQVQRLAR